MSAEEQRFELDNALERAIAAAGNGAAAMQEVNEAIELMNKAIEKLQGSRVYALQEISDITAMITIVRRSAIGSNSIDGMQALANLEGVRSDLTNYANRIPLVKNNLSQNRQVVQLARRDQELDESGIKLRVAVQLLTNFRDRL